MRRTRNPKKSKARSMDAAINALLGGGFDGSLLRPLPPSVAEQREALKPKEAKEDRLAQIKREREDREFTERMVTLDRKIRESKDLDDEPDSEDFEFDSEDDDIVLWEKEDEIEDDLIPSYLDDDDQDDDDMRDFIRSTGTDLSIYDDDDDDDWRYNPTNLFTPLNIGIGVTILGLAGYFGYKHFKKEE